MYASTTSHPDEEVEALCEDISICTSDNKTSITPGDFNEKMEKVMTTHG